MMEMVYKLDFSLPGFLICCIVLGFGMCTTFIISDVGMIVIDTVIKLLLIYYVFMHFTEMKYFFWYRGLLVDFMYLFE